MLYFNSTNGLHIRIFLGFVLLRCYYYSRPPLPHVPMQVLPQNGQAELWHWQGTLWHADCKIMINVAICNIWSKNVNWKMIWFVCNQCWISIRQSRLVNWAIRYCNARLLMKERSRTLKSSIPEIWDDSLPPLRLIVPLLFIAWRTSDDEAQRKCG